MAVAQGRADWGQTITAVARQYNLGFIPVQDEHYDFVVPMSRLLRPPVQRFRALLEEPSLRAALIADGFGLEEELSASSTTQEVAPLALAIKNM